MVPATSARHWIRTTSQIWPKDGLGTAHYGLPRQKVEHRCFSTYGEPYFMQYLCTVYISKCFIVLWKKWSTLVMYKCALTYCLYILKQYFSVCHEMKQHNLSDLKEPKHCNFQFKAHCRKFYYFWLHYEEKNPSIFSLWILQNNWFFQSLHKETSNAVTDYMHSLPTPPLVNSIVILKQSQEVQCKNKYKFERNFKKIKL